MTIDLRQEIIDELIKDLVGPRAENETIEDEAGPDKPLLSKIHGHRPGLWIICLWDCSNAAC